MKPSIVTQSTIILGTYVGSQRAAVVGTLRRDDGTTETGVIERTGATWEALAGALEDAATIGAEHVLILTNEPALVVALSKPFPAPVGGESVKAWQGGRDGSYVTGNTGNVHHWQALRALGWTWAGNWRITRVEDLPAAKQLWETSNGNS